MGRFYIEDVTTIALLYNYEGTSSISAMLPHNKIKEYVQMIDYNLDEMGSNFNGVYPLDNSKLVYFNTIDENDNWYSVLKPDIDIKKARYDCIYRMSCDLIRASEMPNALDILNLQIINGKISKKVDPQQNFELNSIINKIVDNPQEFYEKIASVLSPQEREYLKKKILNKSCFNCTNSCCRVENYEKSKETNCIAWDNKQLIGKQLIKNR